MAENEEAQNTFVCNEVDGTQEATAVSPASTWQEAERLGLQRYFTGRSCRRGHLCERYTKNKHCIECLRLKSKTSVAYRREYNRKYRLRCLADPELRARRYERQRKYEIKVRKTKPSVFMLDKRETARDDAGDWHSIVTRPTARLEGLSHYFTGRSCKHGHVSVRLVSGGCLRCFAIRSQKRYEDTSKREERRLLRDAKKAERARLRNLANREDRRLALAGRPRPEACEICVKKTTLFFDHCHASGKFRGWICTRCNLTLGKVRDNPLLLRKMAEYVESHQEKNVQFDWVFNEEIQRFLNSTGRRKPRP